MYKLYGRAIRKSKLSSEFMLDNICCNNLFELWNCFNVQVIYSFYILVGIIKSVHIK